MAAQVIVNLELTAADLITLYGVGATLWLDSSATEGGAYTNVSSQALAAGDEQYEFSDTAGTSATWYKSRVGDAIGSFYSDYSDPFQGAALTAYASLEDLLETMSLPNEDKYNVLADYLVRASALIDMRCARRFYRRPQVSGTTTLYLDIRNPGASSLVAAIGAPYSTDGQALDIISITTLGYRESASTATYAAIAAGDLGYYLDGPYGMGALGTDWPYEDLSLSIESATRTTLPSGRRALQIVGAFGFPRVPELVKQACIDMAREWFRAGPQGGGQAAGVNQFGVPIFQNGVPHSFRELTQVGSPYVKRSYVTV